MSKKFIFKKAAISSLKEAVSVVADAGTKDFVPAVIIQNGFKAVGDKETGEISSLVAAVWVVTRTSTLFSRVETSVPDGYQPIIENGRMKLDPSIRLVFAAKDFCNILGALLGNTSSDVYLQIDDDGVTKFGSVFEDESGNSKVFEAPINRLSEEPALVDIKAPIAGVKLSGPDTQAEGQTVLGARSLLTKGMSTFSTTNERAASAVFQLNTVTGDVVGFSADGLMLSVAKTKGRTVKLPDEKTLAALSPENRAKTEAEFKRVTEALDKFCADNKAQKKEALLCSIPGAEVKRILRLSQDVKELGIRIDPQRMAIAFDSAMKYTFSLGAMSTFNVPNVLKKYEDKPGEEPKCLPAVEFDNEAFAKVVGFQNSIQSSLGGTDKVATHLEVLGDKLVAQSGLTGETRSEVILSAAENAEGTRASVNGAFVKTVLEKLNAGTVNLRIAKDMLLFRNGSIENPDLNAEVGMLPINDGWVTGEEVEPEEEADGSSSEDEANEAE